MTALSLEYGAASRRHPRAPVHCHCHVVRPLRERVLLGVIGGVGQGAGPARAVSRAAALLEDGAAVTLEVWLARCHEALHHTCGVVMGLAAYDSTRAEVEFLGVGNVQALLVRHDDGLRRARRTVLPRPGVVGRMIPDLGTETLPVGAGDMFILANEGVALSTLEVDLDDGSAQEVAERLVDEQRVGADDARVLVARFSTPGGDA